MKFKDWIINEINKGLVRQFRQQQPNLPKYVAKQVLQNRVSPLWRNSLAATMPTIDAKPEQQLLPKSTMSFYPTPTNNPNHPIYANPTEIYDNERVKEITDSTKWKQEIVQISPLDFTDETIDAFIRHEFGFSPDLEYGVKNHNERMKVQSNLAIKRGQGENEPIIMIREGDKYRMEEGWHRLYSYLLQYSAPLEEKNKIKKGRVNEINFDLWKSIKIKAWIGTQS